MKDSNKTIQAKYKQKLKEILSGRKKNGIRSFYGISDNAVVLKENVDSVGNKGDVIPFVPQNRLGKVIPKQDLEHKILLKLLEDLKLDNLYKHMDPEPTTLRLKELLSLATGYSEAGINSMLQQLLYENHYYFSTSIHTDVKKKLSTYSKQSQLQERIVSGFIATRGDSNEND